MGDFDFTGANFLEDYENIIYMFCWALIVVVNCIVFLNFIIAEAGNSYNKVMEALNAMILKERASMIEEAELMTPKRFKTKKSTPQYIIIREMDM